MSLLDDAKQINGVGPHLSEDAFCMLCHEQVEAFGTNPVFPAKPHKPNCPWLSMPRIVAVLEAVEVLGQKYGQVWLEDIGEYVGAAVEAFNGPGDDDDDD